MNTKKITALALAALMAAGSTATAFAVNKVDGPATTDKDRPLSFNDAAIYEESDGVLKKSNDFRPGDTLYIRLDQMSTTDKKIEDKKDDMKVYADWKVGKDTVESINIVYKKGEAVTSGVQSGAKKYTVSIGGKELTVIPEKAETVAQAIERVILEAMKDPNFLKDERAAEAKNITDVTTGFVIDGKYVASGYSKKTAGLIADGKWYDTTTNLDSIKAAYFGKEGSNITNELFLPNGSSDKVQKGVIAAANPDGTKYTQATKAEWKVSATEDGAVWAVKTADETGLVADDLTTAGLAKAVTGETIVKDTENTVVAQDAKNYIVGANKPAYAYAGANYVTKAEAQAAADKAIASAEAAELTVARVVNVDSSIESTANAGFTYWVEIKTKEDDTTKVLDLAGVLRIGSTKNKAEDTTNAFRLDTSLDNRVYDNGAYVKVVDEWTFKPDSRSVVKFDDDADDVTLYFGENEAAWFEFDARGQSALNLEFTFDFNKEIADLFPKANIDFLTFTSKPSTNRTGDLYIVADEDTFLYEVTEDGVKEIPNAEYSEKEGAWHIRTRKLGAYAISDTELDTSVKVNGKDEASSKPNTSKPNGGKNNPNTGR